MAEVNEQDRVPPYISFRTLRTFIEDLRANRIPPKIDRGAVRHRFSGSVGTQLMSALRFLKLTDADGTPKDALRAIVATKTPEQWREKLREVLEAAYGPVVGLDFASITPEHLAQAFRENYSGQEQVLRKSQTFFLQAVQDAGMELGPRLQRGTRRAPRPRAGGNSRVRKQDGDQEHDKPARPVTKEQPPAQGKSTYQVLIDILDPDKMNDEELDAVWKLIRYLKKSS
jgi:hypothetical protein